MMYEDLLKRAIEQYIDKDYKTSKDPYDPIPYDYMIDLLKQQEYEKKKRDKVYNEATKDLEKYFDEALEKTKWIKEETLYDEILDLLNEIQY